MTKPTLALLAATLFAVACTPSPPGHPNDAPSTPMTPPATNATLRVATFNASLYGEAGGDVVRQLSQGHEGARKVAAIIQHLAPDIILINEFDHDADGEAADRFMRDYLGVSQAGQVAIDYPYRFFAPVNTGVPSGFDLDGDGRTDGPGDAWGYGTHPGQYGMLLLSRHPIDADASRTFQHLRWKDLPGALEVQVPETGAPWYPAPAWEQFPLSSKSHWDVAVDTPLGRIHVLAAHPTPPAFDGPEGRNRLRNHDEIRLWAEYIGSGEAAWLVDDAGQAGRLGEDARFVIVGDYNADPVDGASHGRAIHQLLSHPRVLDYPPPRSEGGVLAAREQGEANLTHRGDPAHDTGNFNPRTGNLRVDYVLPSVDFEVIDSGVHWPTPDEDVLGATEASDHHLVWVDLRLASSGDDAQPAR